MNLVMNRPDGITLEPEGAALVSPRGVTSPFARLSRHRDSVKAIGFSPGGRLMATGSRDRTIRLWSVSDESVRELLTLGSPTGPVQSVAFSREGRQLLTVTRGDSAVDLPIHSAIHG
jgi:WD40 repeat protein